MAAKGQQYRSESIGTTVPGWQHYDGNERMAAVKQNCWDYGITLALTGQKAMMAG